MKYVRFHLPDFVEHLEEMVLIQYEVTLALPKQEDHN